jgi:NitT/TauT family transport system permease protein
MIRGPISRRWRAILGVLSVVVLLLGYTWLAKRQKQRLPDDTTIPTWSQLKDGAIRMFEVHPRTKERWVVEDSQATAYRFFLGVGVGVALAVAIGLIMGCFPFVEALFSPPLTLFAKVPGTAALAVFFVLFDAGGTSMFTAMIVFGVLPSLALSVHLAVADVPDELLNKAYTLGSSHMEVIWNVIVRHITPKMIDAVRLQIGPAMVYLIAAEMIASDVGFGYRIRLQMRLLDMSVVYSYLAILAAFGFSMDFSLRSLQKVCCPWSSR